ncbi:MAG: hypothetical protein AAF705_04325 [Bacteroidota bacterium]
MRQLIFLCLLLPIACAESPSQQMLVGSWEYNLEATLTELRDRGADQNTMNYMQSIMIGLQEANIQFEPRGVVKFTMPNLEEEGSWKLQEKEQLLVLTLDSSEQVSKIDYLSLDTLILRPSDPSQQDNLRILTRK